MNINNKLLFNFLQTIEKLDIRNDNNNFIIEELKISFQEILEAKDKEEIFDKLESFYETLKHYEYKMSELGKKENYRIFEEEIAKILSDYIKSKENIIKYDKKINEVLENLKLDTKKELFILLNNIKDLNFKRKAEKLYYSILKDFKNKDDNTLLELIAKFNNQKSKRYELLAKIILILKHDENNFYKLYDKYKNKTISKELAENFFNEVKEKYTPNIYKNKEGKSGTIDVLIEIDNKLYGIDVTTDNEGIIDNPEGNYNLYQTIRHYIQLYEISKKTGKEIGGYYFLSNFNLSSSIRKLDTKEEKIFEKINNMQKLLHKTFVLDSGNNYKQYKFFYYLYTNNITSFDELIKILESNKKNEKSLLDILNNKLNKIDEKNIIKTLLKNMKNNIMFPQVIKEIIGNTKNLMEENMLIEINIEELTKEEIEDLLSDSNILSLFFRLFKTEIEILREISEKKKYNISEEFLYEINEDINEVIKKIENDIKSFIKKVQEYHKQGYLKKGELDKIGQKFQEINLSNNLLDLLSEFNDKIVNIYKRKQIKAGNNLHSTIKNIIERIDIFETNKNLIEKEKELINEKKKRLEEIKEFLTFIPKNNPKYKELQEEIIKLEKEIKNIDKNNSYNYKDILNEIKTNNYKYIEENIEILNKKINQIEDKKKKMNILKLLQDKCNNCAKCYKCKELLKKFNINNSKNIYRR